MMDYVVASQVTPRLVGLMAYKVEIDFRDSSVIGIVGAGGVGATLNTALDRYEFGSAAASPHTSRPGRAGIRPRSTYLDRAADRLGRGGAAVKKLAHTASLAAWPPTVKLHRRIKHLGTTRRSRVPAAEAVRRSRGRGDPASGRTPADRRAGRGWRSRAH